MKHFLFLATLVVALMGCNKTNASQTTPQKEQKDFPAKVQLCEAGEEPVTCTTLTKAQVNLLDSLTPDDIIPADVYDYDEDDSEILSNIDQYMHLDTDGTDSLAIQYADIYNALTMMHSLINDMEVTERYETPTARAISQMDCSVLHNASWRTLAEQARDAHAVANTNPSETSMEEADDKMREMYKALNVIAAPLMGKTEGNYRVLCMRSTYFTNFAELDYLRGASNKEYQKQLLATYQNAPNFDLKCIWALEFAHSSDENAHFLPGAALLEEVVLNGQYSPYLDEVWATWRVIVSTQFPMSNFGYIPNIFYNKMRLMCANTILNHIQANPKDIQAQAIFINLANRDNIVRHGFIAGNSGAVEQMNIFPEWEKE